MRGAVYTMEAGDSEKSMLKLGPLMTSKGVFRFSAQEWTGLDALHLLPGCQIYDGDEVVCSSLGIVKKTGDRHKREFAVGRHCHFME